MTAIAAGLRFFVGHDPLVPRNTICTEAGRGGPVLRLLSLHFQEVRMSSLLKVLRESHARRDTTPSRTSARMPMN